MPPLPPARPVNRWIPAIAVMSSAVMEVIDTSVVNVSLPHIAGSLSATTDEATWVLTSYIVANAIILPISGWLANYFGRKRLLMTVVTGFTVSSVFCGLAPSLGALVFFRVMQGTTGGGLQPLSQAVLLESFPVEERGTAMAFWSLGIIAAPILGPTLGGWITENYSWRWVFYINLPIGILSVVLIHLYVFDPPYLKRTSATVDVWGLGLMAIGIACFQVMLDKGQEDDWFSSPLITLLAVVAAIGLTSFVVREILSEEPLVDLRLFRFPTYAAGVAIATLLGFVLYGSLVLLPLFMQDLLGFSAEQAGIWSSPRGIGTALIIPLTGYLLGRRWDPRILLATGLVIASVAFFDYSHLNAEAGAYNLMWGQIVQGVGMALVFVPLTTITMDPIPLPSIGYATGIYSLMRNMGASMGISFVTTELARRSQIHQATLVDRITAYNPVVRQTLGDLGRLAGGGPRPPGAPSLRGLDLLYNQVTQQASTMAFVDLFYLLGILFLCALPAIWFMRRPASATAGAAVH